MSPPVAGASSRVGFVFFFFLFLSGVVKMEDVSGLWERFSLTEKEDVPFEFGPADEVDPFFLAARFMTSRTINIESVVRTFTPLWRAVQGFSSQHGE